eukprot:317344-Prorocentrum_minimum.AAC.1
MNQSSINIERRRRFDQVVATCFEHENQSQEGRQYIPDVRTSRWRAGTGTMALLFLYALDTCDLT